MGRVPGRFGSATFALIATALLAQPGMAQPQVWRLSAKPLLILGSPTRVRTRDQG